MPRKVFRVFYPVGLHFLITQLAAVLILGVYLILGKTMDLSSSLLITGAASLILLPVTALLMKRDDWMRSYSGRIWQIGLADILLSFVLGICYGQIGNTVIGLLNLFELFGGYSDMMGQMLDGQSFFSMLLWIGIAAPAAEELVFRGLVYRRLKDYVHPTLAMLLSAVGFGLYHGNVIQFLYATFMGIIFVRILERSRSMWGCILAHMGANIWSVVLTCYSEELLQAGGGVLLGFLMLLLFAGGIFGIFYLKKDRGGIRR